MDDPEDFTDGDWFVYRSTDGIISVISSSEGLDRREKTVVTDIAERDAYLVAAAKKLYNALSESLPELVAAATAEARANMAPTGLPNRTVARDRYRNAIAAIMAARNGL